MADQHVVQRGTGWAVVAAGSGKASATFTTKQQAINMAKAIAKGLQAKLVIHGTSGRVIDMVSYAQARAMAAKQIPILYSGHMALAKVQLRKDVTRRLTKAGDLEIWQSLDHHKQSKKLRSLLRTMENPNDLLPEEVILPNPPSITLNLHRLCLPIQVRLARNYTTLRGLRKATHPYGHHFTSQGSTEWALWLPKVVIGYCLSH